MSKVPRIIRKARLEHRMTMRQFGELLGLSAMTISGWEAGTALPNEDTRRKLINHETLWVKHLGLNLNTEVIRQTMQDAMQLPDEPEQQLAPCAET